MDRVRRAGLTALIVLVMVASFGGSGGARVMAGIVGWPPSTLVVSEVQTGGASASDEFVELANQGGAPVDLLGLEVVYATSSGSTVTRKATWASPTTLDPGKRILLANAAGSHAALADLTYSGGFAATGGAIAIRIVGGTTVDAVGWGDASNGFVEGAAALAPSSGSSLERAPGGTAGNGTDTNDNLSDWFVQAAPSPQGLGAPPVPAPGSSPTPTPTSTPAPTATPSASGTPAPTASPTPSPTPTATPTPTPTPSPTTTATPTPTPTRTPGPIAIAEARALADGTTVTIAGVLTTALGGLESGRAGFIQDLTGGLALYLDAPVIGTWPAGMTVVAEGSLDSRYAQRTLRVAEASIDVGPVAGLPVAQDITTGAAVEPVEGMRIRVTGTISGAPDELADGLGIIIEDGSGPVRAVVGADALAGASVESGMVASVTGPLGQRDSSGTGASGYRIHATLAGELQLAPPSPSPSPTPTPAPTASPGPTATPTATPAPTPAPTATASPSAAVLSLDAVRALPLGAHVRTTGVVVAEAGRLGTPPLLAIADANAGLVVHLPPGAGPFARGVLLEVAGSLAAPYGQLEIRPAKGEIRVLGTGAQATPIPVPGAGLSEATEGRLVTTTGRLAAKPKKSATGDITIVLERTGLTPVKVMADVSSRVTTGSLKVGGTYRVVGFVGQRASRSGALDGYRIWVRGSADLALVTAPAPSGAASSASPSPQAGGGSAGSVTIARALRITDRDIAIDAIVTAPATLLDATGRRIVVQDGSGAIEVLLPADATAPPIGSRIHAEGRIGLAYEAPRLRAERLDVAGRAPVPAPLVLHAMPGEAHEWRLVTISGRVMSLHKLGDRWRAEVRLGIHDIVVVGQPGSGIPSSALIEGRPATVTGIVRRPYPSATDRRFALTPRFPADVRVAGQGAGGASSAGSTSSAGDAGGTGGSGSAAGLTDGPSVEAPVDADLVDLEAFIGRRVRVGGLVVDLRADGFSLDDGTAIGRVVLRTEALERLSLVEPEDALNAIGRVEATDDGAVVVVDDPGGIVFAGDPVPTGSEPEPSPAEDAVSASADPAAGSRFAGLSGGPWSVDPGAAGLGTLVAISALSLAVTLLRRAHARRLFAARIAARLVTFAGPPAGPRDGTTAEREPSTNRSA